MLTLISTAGMLSVLVAAAHWKIEYPWNGSPLPSWLSYSTVQKRIFISTLKDRV